MFKQDPKKYVHDRSVNYDSYNDQNPFITGLYSGCYDQGQDEHNMKAFRLRFDQETETVQGNGTDNVGNYTIDGIYSNRTKRIALNKTYIRGTGNAEQNLGHTVKVLLEFDIKRNEFQGDYHVKTKKYEGYDTWCMWKHSPNRIKSHNKPIAIEILDCLFPPGNGRPGNAGP